MDDITTEIDFQFSLIIFILNEGQEKHLMYSIRYRISDTFYAPLPKRNNRAQHIRISWMEFPFTSTAKVQTS